MRRLPLEGRHFLGLLLLLGAGLVLLTSPALATDSAPQLFERLSHDLTTVPEAVDLAVDLGLVRSNPERLAVSLPDGRSLVFNRNHWDAQSQENYSWFGELEGEPLEAPSTLSLYYIGGRLLGEVYTGDGKAYRLVPAELHGESSVYRLEEIEVVHGTCGIEGHDHGKQLESFISPMTTDTDCTTPATITQIDLLVLYPNSLVGSAAAVQNYATTRTSEANMIFSSSQAKVAYNLVKVARITGEQPPEPPPLAPGQDPNSVPMPTKLALDWLNDQFATAPINTEAEILRRAYGADMVAVVVPAHPNLNCGIANLPELVNGVEVMYGTFSTPFGNKAFSAMELNCGNGDFTFAHELGHNWGMRHDNDRNTRDILPWAYGYVVPANPPRATMMACVDPATPICSRVARVSNPDVNYNPFFKLGLHSSQSATPSHNACVANLRATQYRDFAQPRPSNPPQLTITFPADGADVTPGVAFNLVASATDPEDGNLAASVSWTSDIQGSLGTGSPRSVTLTQPGRHLITASVQDSNGTQMVYSIRLDVVETDPPRRWIDRPSHNELISGQFEVTGWATDASGVVSASFKVDGVPVTLSGYTYGLSRADVCAVHSDLNDPNCPFVGFRGVLDTRQLTNGTHVLQATFTDFFGNSGTFNRTFRTQNVSTRFFSPTADAWVNEAAPTTNYGSDTSLHLRGSGSGLARHTYMKFQVSDVTRPVQSATLSLHTQSALAGLHIYWVQTNSWNENTITWNNAPLDVLLDFATSSHPGNSRIEIDVTSIISGNGTFTIGMVSPDQPGQAISSKESGLLFRPDLEVVY